MIKFNKSELAVLEYIKRDGFFTTDPGQRQRERLRNAARSLVAKGVCKIIRTIDGYVETRHRCGRYTEYSRRPSTEIRIALA
jgi:hypothetical protein